MKRTGILAAWAAVLCTFSAWADQAPGSAVSKEETVFAVLTAQGEVKKVIVSDWLHGQTPGVELRDRSVLTGIQNLEGNERPSVRDGALVWRPASADLYYQGTTDRGLPLRVKLAYSLDGKPMRPQDMAGKAGRVEIRVRVSNTDAHAVDMDGKSCTLYTPMFAAVLLTLPGAVFQDVSVSSNGRLLGDGLSTVAVGLCVPGFNDSLAADPAVGRSLEALGGKAVRLPEDFTVTAVTRRFSLGPVLVSAMPGLPDLGELGRAGAKLDDLRAAVARFEEAATALDQGAAQLADGGGKLHAGIHEAVCALQAAMAGSGELLERSAALMGSDGKVQAARDLLAETSIAGSVDASLLDLIPVLLDSGTRATLRKALSDAEGLDAASLLKAPLVGPFLSDENLMKIGGALQESDSFYRGLELARLDRVRDFLDLSSSFLSVSSGMADIASSFQPERLTALCAAADARSSLEALRGKARAMRAADPSAASDAVAQARSAAASHRDGTASIADPQGCAALLSRLDAASGLSPQDLAALRAVVEAAAARRSADDRLDAGLARATEALSASADLADASAAVPDLTGIADAAWYATETLVPWMERASAAAASNAGAIAAARSALDAKSVASFDALVPSLKRLREVHDANRLAYGVAEVLLRLASWDGGLKASLAKLETLQKDLLALQPVLEAAEAGLSPERLDSMGDPAVLVGKVKSLQEDVLANRELLDLADLLFREENVTTLRALLAAVPGLQDGVARLDDGSGRLAEGLARLSEGMGQFDREGVRKLSEEVSGAVDGARHALTLLDRMTGLSGRYRNFSGIGDGMEGSVKFVLRTEEIR